MEFIDKYITARLPDAEMEPELFDIIEKEGKHYTRHSATCSRPYRVAGKVRVIFDENLNLTYRYD